MNTPTSSCRFSVFTDGGARGNPGPAAVGVVIQDSHQKTLFETSRFIGSTTNNVAEYTALICALEWFDSQNYPPPLSVCFYLDSQLVVRQLSGVYKIKNPTLIQLAHTIKTKLSQLNINPTFHHIPRAQNSRADQLLNQALDSSI